MTIAWAFRVSLTALLYSVTATVPCVTFAGEPVVFGPGFSQMTKGLPKDSLSLLEEYRLNYARLRDFYGSAEIDVERLDSFFPVFMKEEGNPDGRRVSRYEYYSNGNKLFRVDSERLDWKTGVPTGLSTSLVIGPELYFVARRTDLGGALFVVKSFPDRAAAIQSFNFLFPWAPFSYDVWPLEELIFNKFREQWTLTEVRAYEDNGVRLVSITGEGNFLVDKKPVKKRGTFIFLRDSAWALKRFEFGRVAITADTDNVRKAELEYEGEHDGVPMLKHATFWTEQGPEKRRLVVEEYKVLQFRPGAVKESEFLPSALNLAVGRIGVAWWPRIILLLIGASLLACYVVLKRRAAA
jgi:hypothetical protein